MFDDRIEVSNPGGLLPIVAKDFGHKSMTRNPLIFGLFTRMHLVERVASGIPRMQEAMREANLPEPEFHTEGMFTVVLKRKYSIITLLINITAWYMNTDETINKEELTLQNTPKAVNYLINEIAEMRVLLEHIESHLGLGVDKHRPINIEKACQILNQTKNGINKLDLYVSENMLYRAISIFDTIIKGLIFRGHSIKYKDNQTYAIVDGEEIQIRLTERKKQNPNSSNRCDNNNNIFSGELQFYIYHSSSFHSPTLVHDTTYTKIEDKIISIVAYLEIEADNRKTERIEAEEREKRRKEEERSYRNSGYSFWTKPYWKKK